MPVLYSNKKIIPVSTISIDKEYLRTGAGALRRATWKVTVNGTLSVDKGSPDYLGAFWTSSGYPADTPAVAITVDTRLAIIKTKQGALVNLFSTQGKLFEIQPYDGSASIKFVPRVARVSFQAGEWFVLCNYTIEMETDVITFGTVEQAANEQGSDDVQETWQIEPADDKQRTYRLTHSVSSQGNDLYDNSGTGTLTMAGWEVAQARVTPLLGVDFATGGILVTHPGRNLNSFDFFNRAVQESTDEAEGRYSVTETWLLFDGGSYIEDYTVTSRRSLTDGQITVAVEGTVTGLLTEGQVGLGDRYTNADAGWTAVYASLYSRATTVSGVTLNISPYNYSVGRNPNQGVITYNYEFNNRFANQITGALTESIQVQDSLPADIFAIHRVVARSNGPILQDIITNTEQRRSLTISANMPPANGVTLASYPSSVEIGVIAAAYTPTGATQGPYIERNEQSFDYYSGRYTRQVSWVWV